MSFLSLKGWERFQHYKDRDPPWVKFYRDILSSESWVLGTDASRLVQCASVLLAARYANKIPCRYDLIKKVASLDLSERQFNDAIKHLAATNFLEIQEVTEQNGAMAQDASNLLAKCSSETEQRQSREEAEKKVPTEPVEQGSTDDISKVFIHWQQVHRKPRAKLDDKRRAAIRKALKHYSEADLCQAISGYLNSPHHMGQNQTATVYDDIELFLRDSKHVDAGLRFYAEPPRTDLSPKTRAIVAATESWSPPEIRHAAN